MSLRLRGFILVVLAAIIGISLYTYSYFNTKRYFKENLDVNKNFLLLQLKINKLKLELLKSSSFLYYNYDKINKLVKDTQKLSKTIKNSLVKLKKNHKSSLIQMQILENKLELYSRKIEKYLTVNASLKNSLLNIPAIQIRAAEIFKNNHKITLFLIKVYADIFIAKNAMDNTFLEEIKLKVLKLDKLKKDYPPLSKEYKFLESLKLHLVKFIVTFPLYNEILNSLLDESLDKEIIKNIQIFQNDAKLEFEKIARNISILLFLYIISLVVILSFIYKIDIENKNLIELKSKLEELLTTDSLTGLKNMRAFNIDLKEFRHPSLILINIDRFKHINEFYGTKVGDIVLINTSQMLKSITPKEFELYRLGGDDFGVLFENYDKDVGLKRWVEFYSSEIENYRFYIDDMLIELKFSIGASTQRSRLFETADMALKMAKSTLKKFVIYSTKIDKTLEIKANIETISNISLALKEDRLKAYFQPIYNLKTKRIEKYEALARIELKDGSLLKPYDFMESAIEAKLSGDITISMLKQIIEIAKDSRYEFSVNISSSDIESYSEREEIIKILKSNQEVASRIIFELLESEDIYSYEVVDEFIKEVKKFGCKVAIDDFGSGYSNFEKILNLDIDILKIDGSLVKNIDSDEHSKWIVKTILQFAKYAEFETIAEFVYSEKVFKHIINLNFNYAQGYYIGKPSPKIKSDDFLDI